MKKFCFILFTMCAIVILLNSCDLFTGSNNPVPETTSPEPETPINPFSGNTWKFVDEYENYEKLIFLDDTNIRKEVGDADGINDALTQTGTYVYNNTIIIIFFEGAGPSVLEYIINGDILITADKSYNTIYTKVEE